MSAIVARNLSKQFGAGRKTFALADVSFDVAEGEMLVLVGPSGCGKTTTLRCLAGLENPDQGSVKLGPTVVFDSAKGIDVPIHRRDIGIVFQNYALWPHMSARRNIEFPLKMRRVARPERTQKASDVGALVDLHEGLLDKHPAQLSGGQQQRVALARALVSEPRVVLFDEPLSNLDAGLREQLRSELRRLHRRIGFTGVYVTHDLSEAMVLGDRVAAMVDGRIEQIGTPTDLFERPTTARVAELLGYRRLCTMRVEGNSWVGTDCAVTGPLQSMTPQTGLSYDLLAQPDRVLIASAESPVRGESYSVSGGRVDSVGYLGREQEIVVDFSGRGFRLSAPLGHVWNPGDPVRLDVPMDAARIHRSRHVASSEVEDVSALDPVREAVS